MGNLRLSQDGLHLEGISEFFLPLYVNEIQSRRVSCSQSIRQSGFCWMGGCFHIFRQACIDVKELRKS